MFIAVGVMFLVAAVFCMLPMTYYSLKSMIHMKPTATWLQAMNNPTFLTEEGQRLHRRSVILGILSFIFLGLFFLLFFLERVIQNQARIKELLGESR